MKINKLELVELELFYVVGMSCNREVLCGGIIEDS
jgi:hypothetical protein